MILLSSFLMITCGYGQDISAGMVPSLIINEFQKSFPKAQRVEWEKEGEWYKAEFETGLTSLDHEVWMDRSGKIIRHEEELLPRDLPPAVMKTIRRDFKGYRVSDVKKITAESQVKYVLELNSFTRDWEMVFDSAGNVLSQMPDQDE